MIDMNSAETGLPANTSFVIHLVRASKIVEGWPDWKRNILGSVSAPQPNVQASADNCIQNLSPAQSMPPDPVGDLYRPDAY